MDFLLLGWQPVGSVPEGVLAPSGLNDESLGKEGSLP